MNAALFAYLSDIAIVRDVHLGHRVRPIAVIVFGR
jgi:hypothetical protein